MTTEDTFIFKRYETDFTEGRLEFYYQIVRNNEAISFVEKVLIPPVDTISNIPPQLLTNVLHSLFLALGISYWKLYCPSKIELQSIALNKDQATFWNTVYEKGLGELFFKNAIDYRNLVQFPYQNVEQKSDFFPRKNRSLVGIGGGKDSIVSAELLKKHRKEFCSFVINSHPIRDEIIQTLESSKILFERALDPKVFMLEDKDAYSGHNPVSTQYAFFGLLAAVLYDFRYIVVSNEESANYGNVTYLGQEINHQWSKSYEFEVLFRKYLLSFITSDITYFSLLRPLKEIKIVELFSLYSEYFTIFSSCNGNFRANNKTQASKWCKKCAKCLFVFTLLSAFIKKAQLVAIFEGNMYQDAELLPICKELLGIEKFKPFECVGLPEEMQYALVLASQKGEYSNDFLMRYFNDEVKPKLNVSSLKSILSVGSLQSIPEEFRPLFANV
ncbi:MAG: hypothetical protein HZC02_00445 [Candidatus Levybacteria bacterium]|nr:hypothetical protein [Candidatus Levybacteria bacterium]